MGEGREIESRLEKEKLKIERLKVYVNILTVLITVGIGTFGVAYMNSAYQNRQLNQQKLLNEAELQLQEKKAEAERQHAEMKYLGDFLTYALEDDIYKRLRFAEYFRLLTISPELREKWEGYYDNLETSLAEKQKREAELVDAQNAGDQKRAKELEEKLTQLEPRLVNLESISSDIYTTTAMLRGNETIQNLTNVGIEYEEQREPDKAIAAYREAVNLAAPPLNYLAWLYQKQENLDDALALAQVATMMRPHEALYIDTLAVVLCKLERRQEALTWIEKAIDLNPANEYIKRRESFQQGRCE